LRVIQFQSYSPLTDCEVIRLSMADERGQEYYAMLTETEGRAYREMRERAMAAILDAIDAEDAPGEVII
jgi:hypothetical protein